MSAPVSAAAVPTPQSIAAPTPARTEPEPNHVRIELITEFPFSGPPDVCHVAALTVSTDQVDRAITGLFGAAGPPDWSVVAEICGRWAPMSLSAAR